MSLKRLDVYVGVSDMERATAFYKRYFQAEPVLVTDNYTGFDLNGSLFGLFRQDAYGSEQPLVGGNSTVVNVLVEDVAAEFDRVRALEPPAMTDIATVGTNYRFFVFRDHDGNVVEVYETD